MSTFARDHLRFLLVQEVWMPALIFKEYALMQTILERSKIKGLEHMEDILAKIFIARYQSDKPVSGRIAIVLGNVKEVIWEEDIGQIKSFYIFLSQLISHDEYRSNETWNSALKDARNFLDITQSKRDSQSRNLSSPKRTTIPGILTHKSNLSSKFSEKSGKVSNAKSSAGLSDPRSSIENENRNKKNLKSLKTKTQNLPQKNQKIPKSALRESKSSAPVQKSKVQFCESQRGPSLGKSVSSIPDDTSNGSESYANESYIVPTTRDVLPILTKLGYKSINSKYYRPGLSVMEKKNLIEGVHFFSSASELRRFLCRRGVELQANVALSEEDKGTLQKWVRYSICPALRNETMVPVAARKPLNSIHSPLVKLGFSFRLFEYYLPGTVPNVKLGISINGFPLNGPEGLWSSLCRGGLPDNCDFNNISESDRLRLELFLTECPDVNTFDFLSDDEMDKIMSFAFAGVSKKHEVQESVIKNIEKSSLTLEAKEDEVGDNNSVTAESTTYTVVTNCSSSSIIGEKGSEINVNINGNSDNYRTFQACLNSQEREENTNVDSCVDFSDETDINPVRTLFENSPIMEKVQEFSSDLTSVAEDEEDLSYEKSTSRGDEILFLTQDDSLRIGFSEGDDCNNSKAAMAFCNTPMTPNKLVQMENPRSPDQDAMDREMECLLSSRDDDERSLDAEELVGTLCTTSVDQSNDNVNVQAFSQKDNNSLQPSETASFEGEVNSWFETLSGLLRLDDYWEDVKAKMKSLGLKEENNTFFLGLESDPIKQALLFVLSDQELKILAIERLSGKGHEKNFIERSSLKRANHDSQFLDQKRQCRGISDQVDEACYQIGTPLEFDAASKSMQSIGDALQESLYVLQASYKPKSALQFDVEGDSKYNMQVNEILKFLGIALDNINGKHQDNSNNTLYVCGSPGVGKTTAVNWCCERFQGPSTQICRINSASYRDMRFFLADIFENLGIRTKNPSIKGLEEIMKKRCMSVVLVIDEIDSLISPKGISSSNSQSEKLLQELCATVKETSSKIVLIGISNAVESNEAKKLKALGLDGGRILFTPYTQTDLANLVYSRIGYTIIQPKAVEFLAARVASKSGDARWMLELVSHTIRIRYEELSDEGRKEIVSKNSVVSIREAIMAIKSTVVAYVDRIDALPEMAKMVLCVAITLCSHSRSSYSLGMLRSACSDVAVHEQLEPLDFDTFKQLVQQLVDQGLLLPNDDTDSDIGSGGTFAIHDMPVRFGVQLHDIEVAVSDTLETKPVYRKLIESIKRNPNLNC